MVCVRSRYAVANGFARVWLICIPLILQSFDGSLSLPCLSKSSVSSGSIRLTTHDIIVLSCIWEELNSPAGILKVYVWSCAALSARLERIIYILSFKLRTLHRASGGTFLIRIIHPPLYAVTTIVLVDALQNAFQLIYTFLRKFVSTRSHCIQPERLSCWSSIDETLTLDWLWFLNAF